jgi:hypothetical protein
MSDTTHLSAHDRTTPVPPARSGTALRRFTVHYLEMVVAMVAGMVILGPLETLVLDAGGWSTALDRAGVNALVMATNMTVAMAGWMRFRGHTRAPIIEMSAAMYVPFLLLLVPLWQGGISEGTFVLGGHVLMLLGMLLAMLLRREEYTGHHGH